MKSIKRVTLRLSDETMDKIQNIAEKEGETKTHIMRRAINFYVFNYNDKVVFPPEVFEK